MGEKKRTDRFGRKCLTFWVSGPLSDEFDEFVEEQKAAAIEVAERTSASLVAAKAIREYMDKHKKRKGK